MEAALIIAAVIGVAACAVTVRGLDRKALQRAFSERIFQTDAGPVQGADLKVLRFRFERHGGQENASALRTGWWYCEAPGPAWLVVIAQDEPVSLTRVETRWIVRELTQERVRQALG